ncbi:DUF2778 domain-containing protein [Paraburkholderia sp. 31.1]|nr:DUF2778 domain-containing protein [Paraburkholderia sp. 31.1]
MILSAFCVTQQCNITIARRSSLTQESLSPLTIFGVGTFNAFSGNGIYRDRGGCTAIPDPGREILDRGPPYRRRPLPAIAAAKDVWNTANGRPSHHNEWFALYRDDGNIDDFAWVNGIKRGQFRPHPVGGSGLSLGCISLPSYSDFEIIRRALLHTVTVPVRTSGLGAYGTIEVVTYDNTCP